MNQGSDELSFRRILVALDGSYHSMAALEAAADLVAGLEAELEGLYVEDKDLLELSALPVASECPYPYDTSVTLDQTRIERELRAQAEQARRGFVRICRSRSIAHTFRTLRGEVVTELLEAAEGADLLSLGRISRPLIRQPQLGSTARAVVAYARRPVLLMQRGVRVKEPVVVVHHGADEARKAILTASRLARRTAGYLTVLTLAQDAAAAQRLRAQAAAWLRGGRLFIRHQQVPDLDPETLAQTAQGQRCGILVVCLTALPVEALHTLLEATECPTLLV
jgi:nucleotide-binding universal stress UspA family protein